MRGVGAESLVGLFVERSVEMVVGILGILKAGGGYLPLDPKVPSERIDFMLEDSGAKVLVTQEALNNQLPNYQIKTIFIDQEANYQLPITNPEVTLEAHNLAYVIYTSGSTGRPKGVMVTHGNVVRLFSSTDHWFGFGGDDVWTLFHSFAFDFSVWELWGALLYGGKLVVVPYWVSRAPDAFWGLLVEEGVTVLNQTPSAFRQLMGVDGERAAGGWRLAAGEDTSQRPAANGQRLALRYVIFGGEALDIPSLRPWFERHGDVRPQLVNMYGITETTVHVTYRPIGMGDVVNRASVIGRPIPDLGLMILDKTGKPVPIGVAGELYVSGAGVARGYLNRPELTKERFIHNSQFTIHNSQFDTMYRTGDLARWLENGDIEYLGRIDTQVKVRGFRIELGEIEAVLADQAGVETAVVLTRDDGRGVQIVAYLVGDAGLDVDGVRQGARLRLPEYMVPAVMMRIGALPLTANGKLDRGALPEPEVVVRAAEVTLPRGALEEGIAAVWQEILGVDQVGIEENFFDLGGDSLRIIQVHQELVNRLSLTLDVVELFQYPTIQALAAQVGARQKPEEKVEPSVMSEAEDRAARRKAAARGKGARGKRDRRRR